MSDLKRAHFLPRSQTSLPHRHAHRTSNYVIALCVLLICAMQFGLILVKHELRLRLVLTRFSLWRRLQNQTLTTSFSRWRPLAIRAISWEDGLLFSTKLRSRASLAPRLQSEAREREIKKKIMSSLDKWHILYVWSLQYTPDSCSPFSLPFIHSYFVIVQSCKKQQ